MKKTVLVIVDSLDWRWVHHMPTMSKWIQKDQSRKLNTLLGFSASIYACLWPSAYPIQHNMWCHFYKKKHVQRVGFLLRNFYKLIPEFVSIPLRFFYNKYTHNEPGIAIFPPLEDLHYFDKIKYDFKGTPHPINGFPTIFQVLGKDALWKFHESVEELSIPKDMGNDFDAHFLGELDYIAHHHKHDSEFMEQTLKKIDTWLRDLYDYYYSIYGDDFHFFFMSDHGQEEIRKFIDLEKIVKKTKLILFKDYLVFYESGFVRFWVRHKRAESKIRKALSKVKEGRFLTKDDLKTYNVDIPNKDHGNLFFVLEPGNLVFPNYHQRMTQLKNRYLGMHGYAPDTISMKGVFVYKGNKKVKKGEVQIIDIVPSILDILKVKPAPTMKGKPIWKKRNLSKTF